MKKDTILNSMLYALENAEPATDDEDICLYVYRPNKVSNKPKDWDKDTVDTLLDDKNKGSLGG